MAAVALKPSCKGLLAAFNNALIPSPACGSSRCSSWVAQLTGKRGVNLSEGRTDRKYSVAVTPSDNGLTSRFRGDRLSCSKAAGRSSKRYAKKGPFAEYCGPSDGEGNEGEPENLSEELCKAWTPAARMPDPHCLPLEPDAYGEDFKAARDRYKIMDAFAAIDPEFKDDKLMKDFIRSSDILKDLAHERVAIVRRPVPIWDLIQRVPKYVAAAAVIILLFFNAQPSKPAAVQRTELHGRSGGRSVGSRSNAAASRTRRLSTARESYGDQVNGAHGYILPVVATCAAVAMLTQLLNKPSVDKTKLLEPHPAPHKLPVALPDPQITVFRLRVGILGTATSLRMDLDDVKGEGLSVTWPTPFISHNTASGRQKVLSGTARVLKKSLEHIAYASNEPTHVPSYGDWNCVINNLEGEDGTGFHVRNGGTQETLKTVRRSYGYKLQQRLMVDSMKAGYTVVTLTCAIQGQIQLPRVEDTLSLHVLLGSLETIRPEDILDVKLKWDPRKGESLPEETMWVLYPKLQLLAAKEDLEELEGIFSVDA